ncbi:MAG: DNA-directed RNA polymerase subunit alpha [Thermomicrobiales bacterium]
MLERPQFHIETVETGLNYGRYKAEPMEPGYGTTLGNALRRILLRSLEGAAISRIRLDNVWHEFSTIPGVREDVTEIVLNLKRIRLKRNLDLSGDARAHLYVRGDASGERVVTAGDVVWPAEVDVINPDQVIATIDAADGVIDMDIWITQDRGYKAAELQESYAIGEIPIDAIYTPIERVNFVVEHTRVGPTTDFDRLIIEVLTDGTIEPDDALAESARILARQAEVFAGLDQRQETEESSSGLAIPDEILNKPLVDLGLSPRVLNALRSRQIERVGQVLTIEPDQLLSIRNFGPRSLTELREKLSEFGYLPEGDVGIASTGYLDGLDLEDEGSEEFDADLLSATDEDMAEAVALLRGAGSNEENLS